MTDKSSLAAGSLAGALARPQPRAARGLWSSRWVFFLAATGSAVGLGNIWKFPYITGENGGGAFVLVYLACILTIGIPLLMAEVMIGRAGRQNPAGSVARLAALAGASAHWRKVGWLGAFTGFLILSFYVVIAGWALAYVPATRGGAFSGADAAASTAQFDALLADPLRLVLYGSAVLAVSSSPALHAGRRPKMARTARNRRGRVRMALAPGEVGLDTTVLRRGSRDRMQPGRENLRTRSVHPLGWPVTNPG